MRQGYHHCRDWPPPTKGYRGSRNPIATIDGNVIMMDGMTGDKSGRVMQEILAVAEKHSAQAGRGFTRKGTPVSNWYDFAQDLHAALIPHCNNLKDPAYLAFLRRMFEEIFDVLMQAHGGNPSSTLYEFSRAFGACIDTGDTLRLLLPAKARPVLEKVQELAEADAEDWRQRCDQGWY